MTMPVAVEADILRNQLRSTWNSRHTCTYTRKFVRAIIRRLKEIRELRQDKARAEWFAAQHYNPQAPL